MQKPITHFVENTSWNTAEIMKNVIIPNFLFLALTSTGWIPIMTSSQNGWKTMWKWRKRRMTEGDIKMKMSRQLLHRINILPPIMIKGWNLEHLPHLQMYELWCCIMLRDIFTKVRVKIWIYHNFILHLHGIMRIEMLGWIYKGRLPYLMRIKELDHSICIIIVTSYQPWNMKEYYHHIEVWNWMGHKMKLEDTLKIFWPCDLYDICINWMGS